MLLGHLHAARVFCVCYYSDTAMKEAGAPVKNIVNESLFDMTQTIKRVMNTLTDASVSSSLVVCTAA